MNDLHLYLIKVSLGLAIVSVPYYFIFRNDPNLQMKRFYLLAGLALSWISPLITIQRPESLVSFTPTVFMDLSGMDSGVGDMTGYGSGQQFTFSWIRMAVLVYFAGVIFLLLKNLVIILRWNNAWRKDRFERGIAFTSSDQVFTIFTRIFIPGTMRDSKDLENILLHEKAHVKQLHFLDLTFMELTLLLTWFNPFSWLISRMIKENHEYLADRQVLSAGINPDRYRAQLLNHTLGMNVFRLGNQFNHSLTFKRFKMMKKPLKSNWGMVKIGLLIPAILILLGFATGMSPLAQNTIKGKVVFADSGEPAPGASVIIAGTTKGTVTDLNGDFSLTVEGDPEVVVSFVGYSTIRTKASGIKGNPLKLVQRTYQVDPEVIPENESKELAGSLSFNIIYDPEKYPVYVLDGEVVTETDNLDPGTIENIEVFKDPDSEIAKKYNAKEGVILITTSKVKEDAGVKVRKSDNEVFTVVEDLPSFPGGKPALKDYIYSRLEYPAKMKEEKINGEVLVKFVVTAKGKLEEIRVVRSTRPEFNQPALDVFKGMPDWEPGKQGGKPVKVNVVIPVRFRAAT